MKLLRINDVMQKIGVKKTTIYRLVKNNQFPKPVKIRSASLWKENEIDEFIQRLEKCT